MLRVALLNQHPHALHQLADWHYREWYMLYPEKTPDDFIHDLRASMLGDLVPCTWVLLEDNAVIGSTSLLPQDMTTNTDLTPWIANVFIAPQCRGRGLGKVLIKAVMQEAKQQGLNTLYLFTEDQAAFYQGLGWQIIREQQYHGVPVSVMAIELVTLGKN